MNGKKVKKSKYKYERASRSVDFRIIRHPVHTNDIIS